VTCRTYLLAVLICGLVYVHPLSAQTTGEKRVRSISIAYVWCVDLSHDNAKHRFGTIWCQATAAEGGMLGYAYFHSLSEARTDNLWADKWPDRRIVFLGFDYRRSRAFMRAQQRTCDDEADQCLEGMRQRRTR